MYLNVKLQLWRAGIRQNRLARTVGIDESLLSKIINGYRQPKQEIRKKIAAALESDEAWLFGGPDERGAEDRKTPDIAD
jgi:transcriptional regulator with XRE-family HTH domain